MTEATQVTSFDSDYYIGKRLRNRRKLLGMTQVQLASMVGVQFQQIQKYECGDNKISASRLFQLSKALGVKVEYFFEGLASDEQHPASAIDDLMSKYETRVLVEAYSELSPRAKRLFVQIMQEFSAKESEDKKEESKPVLQLLQKAG